MTTTDRPQGECPRERGGREGEGERGRERERERERKREREREREGERERVLSQQTSFLFFKPSKQEAHFIMKISTEIDVLIPVVTPVSMILLSMSL